MESLDEQGMPLFGQILGRLEEAIADGSFGEGDTIPSVRQVAAQLSVNPLTVSRSYQKAFEKGWLERRRGQGFVVAKGARQAVLAALRKDFLLREWPGVVRRLHLLGLHPQALPFTDAPVGPPDGPQPGSG
jgi:GntR family transcriptional regulator